MGNARAWLFRYLAPPADHHMTTTLIILAGILLLPVLYDLLFPVRLPDLRNYFKPGTTYTSKAEGVTQIVLWQEGERVYNELRFLPRASGPPEHLHRTFDECGTVVKGVLTTTLNGQVFRVVAGEHFIMPKGIHHRLYNETDEEVVVRCDQEGDHLPVEFAYSLSELYPLFSDKPSLKMLAKMAALARLFDSEIKGPPPFARLFGITALPAARPEVESGHRVPEREGEGVV